MNTQTAIQTSTRRATGFTLLELSVVLVIIGLIIGAVVIGRDVQRNASYQKIATLYVQGWAIAYDTFASNNGIVIADSPSNPTGMVNAATGTPLCLADLRGAMQAAGISMPEGRSAGNETKAVYLDTHGLPQEMAICFENVGWSVPGIAVGSYMVRNRNVMTLTGLTPALAKLLDNHFDARIDARFGKFREQSVADATGASSVAWSQNVPALDESQAGTMNAYLLMNQ